MKKTYAIINYGCQMNESDSEHYAGQLLDLGYEASADYEHADVVVINTCCVRENAEKKILGKIGEMKRLKRENPDMVLCVAGCMAQEWGKDLQKKYPQVDLVLGTAHVNNFSSILQNHLAGHGRAESVYDDLTIMPQEFEGSFVRKSSFAAWVPIMYGCNNFCTYCIVPYVRGRERSRKPEDIIKEIEKLAADGVTEVMLLGQNVNSYGKNLETPMTFAELLREVEKIDGIRRIRFMTSHPKDLSDELIQVMKESRKICRHLHLPLQSGSSRIMKAMNRGYDRERYLKLVETIRRCVPDAVITTDLIVGFPGETEKDFEETLDLLRTVEYDDAFTFIYSPRKGTPAAGFGAQVPDAVKHERLDRLMALQNEICLKRNKRLVGRTLAVMVEGPSKSNPAMLSGRTDGNDLVLWPKIRDHAPGDLVNVKMERAQTWLIRGKEEA